MKKFLFVLVAIFVGGICAVNASDITFGKIVSRDNAGTVYEHCIDGAAYLTYAGKSIIRKETSKGFPSTCK